MVDIDFLEHKLQIAPAGFGYADIGEWLQDVPYVEQLADINLLFFKELTRKQWLALIVLLKQRYINDGPATNLFDDHFEQHITQSEPQNIYQKLAFYEEKSQCLDFSLFSQLSKLIINASRQLETIIFPQKPCQLEALELSYLPRLECVEQIQYIQSLMYLTINHCPKLQDFSFIKKLKKILWLDLSGNKQLIDLSFLMASSSIVFLHLLDTDLLDNPKTIKQLSKLKYLRYLTVSGKQIQIVELRERLPNCVVNGMSAYKIKQAVEM